MTQKLLRLLRGATIIAAVTYGAALLYWSYPYLKAHLSSAGATLEEPGTVEAWPEAAALREDLRRKFTQYKPAELMRFRGGLAFDGRHPLTPLVEAVFVVQARPERSAQGAAELEFEYRMVDVGLRGDRLIWATAILALMVLLARDQSKQRTGGEEDRAFWQGDEAGGDLQGLDLPKLLHGEVRHYQGLCNQTYARSTFLLWGAAITAMGGFGALIVLPESVEAVANSSDLWVLLTRSYGIVLVVNALALVFLRQYRFSTEDYRYMVNLRWRRVNLLAASLDGGKRELVIKALLAEPYPEEQLRREGGATPKEPVQEDEMEGGILTILKKAFKPDEKEK